MSIDCSGLNAALYFYLIRSYNQIAFIMILLFFIIKLQIPGNVYVNIYKYILSRMR